MSLVGVKPPPIADFVFLEFPGQQVLVRKPLRVIASNAQFERSFLSADDLEDSSRSHPMSSEPSEFEARHYYDGVSPEATGPKLIYRTSDDLFERPANPETASRLMSVIPVAEHDEMGRQGLWDFARDQVRF